MGNKLSLEKIAFLLDRGEIDNRRAEVLIGMLEKKSKPTKSKSNVRLTDDCFYYFEKGKTLAYLQFYQDRNSFGESFVMINKTESYEQGKGYFSVLLGKLESFARGKNFSHLCLEVDAHNIHAISVYESKGFYSLGPLETVAENIDRIIMRKDLLC